VDLNLRREMGKLRDIGEGFMTLIKRWAIAIGAFIALLVGLLIWRW